MKTEVTNSEKIRLFEGISHNKSEAHSGIFFQIVEPNKEFLESSSTMTVFEITDVLITIDQDYFTPEYENGEICFNLTKSELIYVPYDQKICTLITDEPIKFIRV